MITGIYKIENVTNGKIYIGSAVSMSKRWTLHKCLLSSNRHHSKHLQSSWNLCGEDKFIFSAVEICPKEDLIAREQYYIDTLNPEYNMCRVAGSPLGRKHTQESKDKMSRRVFSAEHRAKISKAKLGHVPSPETIEKFRQRNIGKVRSQESRDKQSASNKGKKLSEEGKRNISKSLMGHAVSEETRLKLSDAAKRQWIRIREAENK